MSFAVEVTGLKALTEKLNRLSGSNLVEVLDTIGAVVESQTRDRLQNTKTAPDGSEWPPWSPDYALTRHGGHSLLQDTGALTDSIQWILTGDSVEVGSNLVYAAVHQFGHEFSATRKIPARTYVGLSPDNEEELVETVTDFVEELLKEGRT